MKHLSVIIPSRTTSNFVACVSAIRNHEPDVRIILVDDGVNLNELVETAPCLQPWMNVTGEKPFIFSRNVNIGIAAAEDDDVIVLGDDALLTSPRGFSALHEIAEQHQEFGIIAAATNNVGNINQHPRPGGGLRYEPRQVCFICVIIPRRTIETVGLMDERFVGYGIDDDDYSLRVRNAGLKLGIFDGCVIDHSQLPSTYRQNGGGDFRPNLELFKQKWGIDNFGNPCSTQQS